MGRNKKNTRKLKRYLDDNTVEIKNNMVVLESNMNRFEKLLDDIKNGITKTLEAIIEKIDELKKELKRQDDFVYGILDKESSWIYASGNRGFFYEYINGVYNILLRLVSTLENSRKIFGYNNENINDSIDIFGEYLYDFCAYSVNPSFKNLTKKINYQIW